MSPFNVLEICAGAGGCALGLESAGFEPVALVENDPHACQTLRHNRPHWPVVETDLRQFKISYKKGVDLLSGGVPCSPFSVAGRGLGAQDERDLFPEALRLVDEIRPTAVMLENVSGFLAARFAHYRNQLKSHLQTLGYEVDWQLLNAADYGISQSRTRVIIVALQKSISTHFTWPAPHTRAASTVGQCLYDVMAERGWLGVKAWCEKAVRIAPTIVGGSRRHGGADLGPKGTKQAWKALGVDGSGIAADSPAPDFVGMPRLTLRMVARLQGFPDDWHFSGSKTAAYRQVGNALPSPVAHAVASSIRGCIQAKKTVF